MRFSVLSRTCPPKHNPRKLVCYPLQPMASVAVRVAMCRGQINAWIEEFNADDTIGLKGLAVRCVDALDRHGLILRDTRCNSMNIAPHPENREGDGVDPVDVHEVLDNIIAADWDTAETSHAMAFQMPPKGSRNYDKFVAFVEALGSKSNGILPPYRGDEIQLLSISCSHTAAGQRCVLSSAPALKATIRGSDGKLSFAKLQELRPLVANAARDGLVWKVLRWEVDEACPRLAEILQAAGSAGQQAARPVTEFQCLQRIIKDAALVEASGDKPDWHKIGRKAERIAPKLKGQIKDLCTFAAECAFIVPQVDAYLKSLTVKRVVRPQLFAAIAKVHPLDVELYLIAVLKAMYSSSAADERGESKLLSPADITAINERLRPFAKTANDIIGTARAMALERVIPDALLDTLEIRLVHHVQGKSSAFMALFDIGWSFLDSVEQHLDIKLRAPSGWPAKRKGQPLVKAAPPMSVRAVRSDGKLDPLVELARKGVVVGGHVKNASNSGTIARMSDTAVDVVDSGGTTTTITPGDILHAWTVLRAAKPEERVWNARDIVCRVCVCVLWLC
jgi:hypothetical protein